VVAGDADAALDQDEVRGFRVGLEEDDDVAAVDWTVVHEGRPFSGWREGGAVDDDVVADKKRVLHGGRGDLEVLEDEALHEEEHDDDGADGGQGFERGLGDFGPGLRRCGQSGFGGAHWLG